jgi:hypothetical protein
MAFSQLTEIVRPSILFLALGRWIEIRKARRYPEKAQGSHERMFHQRTESVADPIEYVFCHELCRLRHLDHGTGFYRLLARRMPDWASAKGAFGGCDGIS